MELLKRKPNFFEEEMDSYPYTNDELDYFGPWIGDFGDYMEPTWQRLYMMACNASLGHVRSNLASWTHQGSWDHQGSQYLPWDHQGTQYAPWDHQGSKPKSTPWDHQGSKFESTSEKSIPKFPWSSAPARDNNSHR